jgi:hypothetical protein
LPKRSKAKTLEQKIVEKRKLIDLTASEFRQVLRGQRRAKYPVKVPRFKASVIFAIAVRNQDFTCWQMALLVNDVRVGGVDWEGRVHDHRGHKCSGWHKHIWIAKSAKSKECLPDFSPNTPWEFVRLGLGVLNIDLRKGGDDGNLELFDD